MLTVVIIIIRIGVILTSVINATTRFCARKGSWLARMLERKPKLLVAITLANRMARGIWAMLTKKENYRNPEAMA